MNDRTHHQQNERQPPPPYGWHIPDNPPKQREPHIKTTTTQQNYQNIYPDLSQSEGDRTDGPSAPPFEQDHNIPSSNTLPYPPASNLPYPTSFHDGPAYPRHDDYVSSRPQLHTHSTNLSFSSQINNTSLHNEQNDAEQMRSARLRRFDKK